MTQHKGRLEKLAGLLTPKQYVLTLVDEMQQHGSMEAYNAAMFTTNWDGKRNEFGKVLDGIRARMKGQSEDQIRQAVRKAQREGGFLFQLLVRMSTDFMQDRYRHAYNGLMLLHLWQRAQNESLREIRKKKRTPEELSETTAKIRQLLDTFKARAPRHLYHVLSARRVVEEISRRYFDGRELMFKQDRENLEALTKQALGIINGVDDVAGELAYMTDRESFGEDGPPPLVDVEGIRAEVERDLERNVQFEIDMAKADLYGHLDKPDEVRDIFNRYHSQLATGTMPSR